MTPAMPVSEFVGKVVVEAMTVAIGVSVGTAQLGDARIRRTRASTPARAARPTTSTGGQVVVALCGAMLLAANVAPTEEIVRIAAAMSAWRLGGLVGLSLALSALILYYSAFTGARRRLPPRRAGGHGRDLRRRAHGVGATSAASDASTARACSLASRKPSCSASRRRCASAGRLLLQ